MSRDAGRILEMLSEEKITVAEAERLLEALRGSPPPRRATQRQTEEEAQREGVGASTAPEPGVRVGVGADVSPDVELAPGSVIGMGAKVRAGVVIEGRCRHRHGSLHRRGRSSAGGMQDWQGRERRRGGGHRREGEGTRRRSGGRRRKGHGRRGDQHGRRRRRGSGDRRRRHRGHGRGHRLRRRCRRGGHGRDGRFRRRWSEGLPGQRRPGGRQRARRRRLVGLRIPPPERVGTLQNRHTGESRYPAVVVRGWTDAEEAPPPSVFPAKAVIQGRGGPGAAASPPLLGSRFHGSDGWKVGYGISERSGT